MQKYLALSDDTIPTYWYFYSFFEPRSNQSTPLCNYKPEFDIRFVHSFRELVHRRLKFAKNYRDNSNKFEEVYGIIIEISPKECLRQ